MRRRKNAQPVSMKQTRDRRCNPYNLQEFQNHPLGVEIGEGGFQVCDAHSRICPVPAVPEWEEAMELLDIINISGSDRRRP
jgi:hypothetical protein